MSICPKCKKTEMDYIPWSGFQSCRKCGHKGQTAIELTAKALLSFLRKIPKGKVTTYKALAKKFSLHPRTVAKLLSQNKQPERFPCYKVIASDGLLGGYSGKGKLVTKRKLLKADGILIKKSKIDLKIFGWAFECVQS
jgi:methylated-DNA-[protein]-cysteine S-methyltransferase